MAKKKAQDTIADLRRLQRLLEIGCGCGHVEVIDPVKSGYHGRTGVDVLHTRMICRRCNSFPSYSRAL